MALEHIPYDSVIVAQYMIVLTNNKKKDWNATKIQKLLYIAYGLMLADTGSRLIIEQPQAWPFGPVFPRSQKIDYNSLPDISTSDFTRIKNDDTVKNYLEVAIDNFAKLSAGQLSDWSHEKGSPWDKTVNQAKFKWGTPISDELIKEYFMQFIINENQ